MWQALQQHGAHRHWRLLAAHVRSSHVHIVVAAEQASERILLELKAYASHALGGPDSQDGSRKRWSRHGSTRYLWHPMHGGSGGGIRGARARRTDGSVVGGVIREASSRKSKRRLAHGSTPPLPGGRGSDWRSRLGGENAPWLRSVPQPRWNLPSLPRRPWAGSRTALAGSLRAKPMRWLSTECSWAICCTRSASAASTTTQKPMPML